jgi:hypothetical protein
MNFKLLLIFLALPFAGSAAAESREHLDTRYGQLDVRSSPDSTVVTFRGNALLTLAVDSASLYRIAPKTNREYAVVETWQPGLNCHHTYYLVELSANGAPLVSREFGECAHLGGAEFIGDAPVVHLKSLTENQSYVWRRGEISALSASAEACKSLDSAGRASAQEVEAKRQVAGPGRLPFFSAPSEACPLNGLFVVPGNRVDAHLTYEDFVFATYANPKTGKKVEGWIDGKRLHE